MPFSMMGAPASTFTPPGRKLSKARCAVMASAFSPTMSFGRPGRCTSPADTIVVTPPFIVLSIQPSWFWRGVQSPNTGCTWLSIRPGQTQVCLASMVVLAWLVSQSACLPIAVMRPSWMTTVSASRMGLSMSPDSSSPMFLMTTLPDLPSVATSAICLLLNTICGCAVASGGAWQRRWLRWSALRTDSPAMLAPRARRATRLRCAPAQTLPASQMLKRAVRAALDPALLGTADSTAARHRPPLKNRLWFSRNTTAGSAKAGGGALGRAWEPPSIAGTPGPRAQRAS